MTGEFLTPEGLPVEAYARTTDDGTPWLQLVLWWPSDWATLNVAHVVTLYEVIGRYLRRLGLVPADHPTPWELLPANFPVSARHCDGPELRLGLTWPPAVRWLQLDQVAQLHQALGRYLTSGPVLDYLAREIAARKVPPCR